MRVTTSCSPFGAVLIFSGSRLRCSHCVFERLWIPLKAAPATSRRLLRGGTIQLLKDPVTVAGLLSR